MPRHEIVVSAENNHYLAWQVMLFHFSCLKHLGQAPIVMVHKLDEPLLPDFERIRETGGRVQTAPNYRDLNGVSYAARNTAGSLRHVETDADYIVLCDPDMIFLQPLPLDKLRLSSRQISFDFCGYLDPDTTVYQPTLDNVCRQVGLDPTKLRQPVVDGGVPHVIPRALQKRLSDTWLELIEEFPTITDEAGVPQKDWLATMWALVMATHRLGLEPVMTNFCITNCFEDRPLPRLGKNGPRLLHYCYGNDGFNKRHFTTPTDAEDLVWNVPRDNGSTAGAIRHQLREAGKFYGLRNVSPRVS
ncbi:MAG: hypothetical protein FD138_1799 [Planctomycetota bacterium]|nr:MAG: hypothetical protein FD138_1799 [Planctomycetota bacterium]